MTKRPEYFEVRRVREDPWDFNNLLWSCDTRDEAERRMSECILRGAHPDDVFIVHHKNEKNHPVYENGKKVGYLIPTKDNKLVKIALVE